MSYGHRTPPASVPRGIVELVGPAGSGKSTLLRRLGLQGPGLRMDLALWGQPRSHLIASAIALLPTAALSLWERRPLRPSELAQMIRIDALQWRVRDALAAGRAVPILDEGPVFGLTWLRVAHGARGGRARAGWRRRVIAAWARALLFVVRLDATDAALGRRIRTRAKPHPLKGASDGAIASFSAQFRQAFDETLTDLAAQQPLTVLRYRTDEDQSERAVSELLSTLAGLQHGH